MRYGPRDVMKTFVRSDSFATTWLEPRYTTFEKAGDSLICVVEICM